MSTDRITEIRVSGFRCIDDLCLPVGELTVLIGENGAGKSTLIEALELLRLVGAGGLFKRLYDTHGGLRELLRHGCSRLGLGVSTAGDHGVMHYDLVLSYDGSTPIVLRETLNFVDNDGKRLPVLLRGDGLIEAYRPEVEFMLGVDLKKPDDLLLRAFGQLPPHPAIGWMMLALANIDVHVSFRVRARWARAENERSTRDAVQVRTTDSLEMFGVNIANAYYALRHDFGTEHWEETLDLVRLGLGYDIESVDASTHFATAPGSVALAIRDSRFRDPIPATSLSDGMLAYLSFVALCRLNTHKSIVAFDEPELHLHPGLLARVTALFERLSETTPVLLATHSNQLLDCLSNPVGSVVRCELDEKGASQWTRPDAEDYEQWLAQYAGLGAMRAAGVEPLVMTREVAR